MRTLDRYVIRETIPPFLIALAVFTLLFAINPMMDYARSYLTKGVGLPTIGWLLLLLVPQAMSLTVPMAFLTAVLIALGRLSGDRESVALLACGVSPLRLLRPILLAALAVASLDLYLLMRVKPDANQAFRDTTVRLITEQSVNDIKPRVFFEQFPGKVLFIRDTMGATWSGVFLADTTDPVRPVVTLAETGSLTVDARQRVARIVLGQAAQYSPGPAGSGVYATSRHETVSFQVTAESVFGSGELAQDRGLAELDYAGLRVAADRRIAAGDSPHNEIMHLQQMFSFPAACLVFGVLGLALGLHTRKEGRLAGMTLGVGVIVLYYFVMTLAEAWVKGSAWASGLRPPAAWARWVPNLLFVVIGILAVWWRVRGIEGVPLGLPSWLTRRRAASSHSSQDFAVRDSGPSRPVVRLRMPRLALPRPRILDSYVARHYVQTLVLVFVALLSVAYISATVDLADKLLKPGNSGWQLVRYLWYVTPQFITWVVPIAVLLATLTTIGALTRSSELMVMRACGVSLYRTAAPLVLFAIVWAGGLFWLGESVLAQSNRAASQINNSLRGLTSYTLNLANHNWLVGEDGELIHYGVFERPSRFNGNRPTLHGLSVYETLEGPYRLNAHTHATRVTFEDGSWQAADGWRQELESEGTARSVFGRAAIALPPVDSFQRAQVDASQMTFAELRQYVKRLGAGGFNVSEQRVGLHQKAAFPAVTLIMTLLAVPFGVTTGRKGTLYGVGLAIVLAGTYFLLTTFFAAAGAAGVMPAPLAAWAPNLLFASGALYMILTVRT